jgi:hypothetical protein
MQGGMRQRAAACALSASVVMYFCESQNDGEREGQTGAERSREEQRRADRSREEQQVRGQSAIPASGAKLEFMRNQKLLFRIIMLIWKIIQRIKDVVRKFTFLIKRVTGIPIDPNQEYHP